MKRLLKDAHVKNLNAKKITANVSNWAIHVESYVDALIALIKFSFLSGRLNNSKSQNVTAKKANVKKIIVNVTHQGENVAHNVNVFSAIMYKFNKSNQHKNNSILSLKP